MAYEMLAHLDAVFRCPCEGSLGLADVLGEQSVPFLGDLLETSHGEVRFRLEAEVRKGRCCDDRKCDRMRREYKGKREKGKREGDNKQGLVRYTIPKARSCKLHLIITTQ